MVDFTTPRYIEVLPTGVVPSENIIYMFESNIITINSKNINRQYWKDLFHYRELFFFLAWRDITARYKQTAIGFAWSFLRPFLIMIVFTLVFGKWAKLSSDGVPYPILVFTALLPWQFFANSLIESSNSLISNANLITKVYFPRLIIPISATAVSFVDFLISFVMLIGLMIFYKFIPDYKILTLPLFVILAYCTSIGGSLWLSALNVKYRDFKQVSAFIVQFGLYISPVGFSSSIVPEKWRLLYSINPLVGVIDGFRWAILGNNVKIYFAGFILSIFLVMLLLISGIWYFRKTERTFADII